MFNKSAKKMAKQGAQETKTAPPPLIFVDYPQEGEKIGGQDYTFRVGAPETAKNVEIRINLGPWQTCRLANGYWWYDWAGFEPGKYQATARMLGEKGIETALPRNFQVKKEQA